MNWQYLSAKATAIILAILAGDAQMPDSISNQIPILFPEQYRAKISIVLAILAYIAHEVGTSMRTPAGAPSSVQPQVGAIQPTIKP